MSGADVQGWVRENRTILYLIVAAATGMGGGVALPDVVTPAQADPTITARVDTLEARQERIRGGLSRVERGVQFLVCRDRRREEGGSLESCERYWSAQDEDFLPPQRSP